MKVHAQGHHVYLHLGETQFPHAEAPMPKGPSVTWVFNFGYEQGDDMVCGKFGQMGTDLGIRPAMLSVLLQVLFWSEVVAPGNLRTH
jgi:hypothetical protein